MFFIASVGFGCFLCSGKRRTPSSIQRQNLYCTNRFLFKSFSEKFSGIFVGKEQKRKAKEVKTYFRTRLRLAEEERNHCSVWSNH